MIVRSLLPVALIIVSGWVLTDASAATKPMLVHYMPWYVAKPYSSSWGWHWTMNHYNPDTIDAAGERQIASWYHPLIGPYDSADPVVLEYHVLLMKLAGVDGVIVDWYGMDNFLDYGVNNERTAALFEWTRRAGLRFSICYEDRTITEEINRGFIAASDALPHAQRTMRYLETNYFVHASYLRRADRPVLLNFGPQYFKTSGQWTTIFSVLTSTNQPAFFTLDNRVSGAIGAFNWPPMWLSQSTGGVLSPSALSNYLVQFEQKASSWPAFVSSAFPRFHDIYAQAGVGSSHGTLNDSNGETFRSTLARACTNASFAVQVVTWNDYGEGTVVEPTKEHGYRDLGIIQDLRRQYLTPSFSYTTNDLTLPTRLYKARRQHGANALLMTELNRVFTNAISGKLDAAKLQLLGIESGKPVIYDLIVTNASLQFSLGGFVPGSGLLVEMATDLSTPDWKPQDSFPADTALMRFSTEVENLQTPVFFRVRSQ